MKIFRKIFKFFDRTEDKTRSKLSKYPVLYAIIGAVGLVLLWRGVWMVADSLSVFDNNPFDKAYFIDGAISIGASFVILFSFRIVRFVFYRGQDYSFGPEERKENGRKNQRRA